MSNQKRRAFTMLEIMVVVAIIAVLLGFALYAFNGVRRSAKDRATRVTLGNLKGMLAELESQSGTLRSPATWVWLDSAGTNIIKPPQSAATAPVPYAVDFWKDPYHFPNDALTTGNPPGLGRYDSLIAPTSVVAETDIGMRQRFGSIAVINTGLAMNLLASAQANKSRFGAIPSDQTLVLEWTQGEISVPGGDHFFDTADDPAMGAQLTYIQGAHVRKDDRRYVATAAYVFGGGAAPVANGAPTAPWYDETDHPNANPVLLDGWGNPIIFVPATGLRVRLLNAKDKFDPLDKTQNIIIVSPEGQVQKYDPTLPNTPYVITPGRPFWASAGPDGNFATGDDNLYSFEQ